MKLLALLLTLASSAGLGGCALTPRRAELQLAPAPRHCPDGCLHFNGRRILFRYSF